MNRLLAALICVAILVAPKACGLDLPGLPIRLNFQLGFNITVLPGPNDTSHQLGLGVTAAKPISDKVHLLTLTGTITNYSGVPRENIDMHFAVTSYVGTGTSNARATVEPSTIPPGGTATYTAYIPLDSEKPQYAMYTITAQTPMVVVAEPVPAPAAVPEPAEYVEVENAPDPGE